MLLLKFGRNCAQIPKFKSPCTIHNDSLKDVRYIRRPLLRSLIYSHVRCCSGKPATQEGETENEELKSAPAKDADAEKSSETTKAVKEDAPSGDEGKKKFTRDVLFDHYVAKSEKTLPRQQQRAVVNYDMIYTGNTFIKASKAIAKYLLTKQDLEDLRTTKARTTYSPGDPDENIYMQRDVEKVAMDKWGSMEALELEHREREEKMASDERQRKKYAMALGQMKKDAKDKKKAARDESNFGTREEREERVKGSRKVVEWAILMNCCNTVVKCAAWYWTGSAALFAEMLHSLADTVNQMILWYGIQESIKDRTHDHPYGYDNSRYIWALVSGCSIFFIGCGVSVYHGITTFMEPSSLEHLEWAFGTLFFSFLFDGFSWWKAYKEVHKKAKETGMTFWDYTKRGSDPNAVAVFLEDSAALVGVLIAASGIYGTYLTGNAAYDAMGSICVGATLGLVAGFLIDRNKDSLMQKSVPPDRLDAIQKVILNDRMVHGLDDVKTTEMGANTIRFKAEVDFDGREVTRAYLQERVHLPGMLEKVKNIKTEEEVAGFIMDEGEQIIDTLARHIDRIEDNVREKFPEVRHIDLECSLGFDVPYEDPNDPRGSDLGG